MTFYLCDRKKCDVCHKECHHTTDLNHAINKGKETRFINLPNGNLYEIEIRDRATKTEEETSSAG